MDSQELARLFKNRLIDQWSPAWATTLKLF
jgi:hypothetical protein